MHRTISSPGSLIAQLPYFYGFDLQDSLIIVTTTCTTHLVGPLIRIDIPHEKYMDDCRVTITRALRQLSDREYSELIIVLVSSHWDSDGALYADEIEELCEDTAYKTGFTIRDFYMARSCHPQDRWVSLFTGEQGKVSQEPLARDSHIPADDSLNVFTTAEYLLSREDTRHSLEEHINDTSLLSAWEVRSSHVAFLPLPTHDELYTYLDFSPTTSVKDKAAVSLHQFFLRTIESYQGADGLISLLVDDKAERWVAWMWVLLPTLDLSTRPYVLLTVALWHYMHGDGFRTHTLLDQAESIDPTCASVITLRQLLNLCVEPAAIRTVIDEIAGSQ